MVELCLEAEDGLSIEHVRDFYSVTKSYGLVI